MASVAVLCFVALVGLICRVQGCWVLVGRVEKNELTKEAHTGPEIGSIIFVSHQWW